MRPSAGVLSGAGWSAGTTTSRSADPDHGSERVGGIRAAEMLNSFYDACSSAVWERDGIVNKFIGDALLAIFNFPIMRDDHVRRAVLAGVRSRDSVWRTDV